MLKDKLVVLTEEEYEALQDSRFAELPALLVGDLRHALESATPDTRMGCLLRNLLPYLRKPQVPAEVIALVYEGIDEVRDAMAAVPLSGRMSDERQEVDRKALAGCRLAVQSYTTCVEALLAAVEAAPEGERLTVPPVKHRFAEWCGENFAAIWYEFSLLRNELGLPQPECDEEASGSEPAPAPDFASMTPEDLSLGEVQALRDWLRHEGLLEMHDLLGGQVQVTLWAHDGGTMLRRATGPTERAALLALCQKVAAKEASC